MVTPVTVGAAATIPEPSLIKYQKYPANDKKPRVVVADVVSSSLGETSKVFSAGDVIQKVNHQTVNTMSDLCKALSKPVKDAHGMQWVAVEMESGKFAALPYKAALANDQKLEKTGMLRRTTCGTNKAAKKATKKVKKAVKKAKKAVKKSHKKAKASKPAAAPKFDQEWKQAVKSLPKGSPSKASPSKASPSRGPPSESVVQLAEQMHVKMPAPPKLV